MSGPDDVLAFWLDEVGPRGWYTREAALDEAIRVRFGETWRQARDGALAAWLTCPSGALAYIIVTDQFSRNMFREDPRAFATDKLALAAAKCAVKKGWDMRVGEPARQFFYLPMMHSESLMDQNRCVRLMHSRMPETGGPNLLHAKVHREVIRLFGRFPSRNGALSRKESEPERVFIEQGGYRAILQRLGA